MIRFRHVVLFLVLLFCLSEEHATEWSVDNLLVLHLKECTRYVSVSDGMLRDAERNLKGIYLNSRDEAFVICQFSLILQRLNN